MKTRARASSCAQLIAHFGRKWETAEKSHRRVPESRELHSAYCSLEAGGKLITMLFELGDQEIRSWVVRLLIGPVVEWVCCHRWLVASEIAGRGTWIFTQDSHIGGLLKLLVITLYRKS